MEDPLSISTPFAYKNKERQGNIEFLKHIKKHECLWKHDSPNYTNKAAKIQAWKNISKALNCSVETCNRRWRYVRQAYSYHVRTNYSSTNKQSGYYLSPHIEFVRPYVKLPPCHESLLALAQDQKEKNDQLSKISRGQNSDKNNEQEDTVIKEKVLEQQFLELIEETSEASPPSCSTSLKHKIETAQSIGKRNIEIDCIKTKMNDSKTNLQENRVSKNWMFLESTLPFVDEMTPVQTRRFRRKVMALINDVLENKGLN